jgi:hypothetical protein
MFVARGSARPHARTSLSSSWLIGLLLALMWVTGSALAGETLKTDTRKSRETPSPRLHLEREKLMARVSIEMESISTFERAAEPGQRLHDHVLFDEMTERVRSRTKRMAKRAVKDYLIESLRLDRSIERVRQDVGGGGARSVSRDLDIDVGIHSFLPELDVKYRYGHGQLRFSLGVEGDVGIRFRSDRIRGASFSAGFDGDDTYRFGAYFGF